MTKQVEETTNAPGGFKRGKALLLPTISIKNMKAGDTLFVECLGDFTVKPDTDDQGEPRMENGKPVELHLLPIIDLSTGNEGEIVVPFMMRKGLPESGLKGQKFEMIKGEKKNRTQMWTVYGEAA